MKREQRTGFDLQEIWHLAAKLALPIIIAFSCILLFYEIISVKAAGILEVKINAGYNLVVDSNASSPSTYAPSVATVMGEFCNTGNDALTDVWAYIGDYVSGTPGDYPDLDSGTELPSTHPLYDTGVYYFTHMGGSAGLGDASRYIGDLAAGQCVVQYWHFSYPQCSESDRTPPCSGLPLWGSSVGPEDDLALNFDIWGAADDGSGPISSYQSWTMTMRNEISAMANKIEPNPDGQWFNTETNEVRAGEVITSNGILYELGNINKGFDNDGDYTYDYNAWMQPVGDAGYDPSCFQLIRTSGVLTVSRSGGKPDLIVPFENQLYFTNLPEDNTGVVGNVYYTFLALNGRCTTSLSPYQEVASGADNEKFNGDYGTGIPPVISQEPEVTLDKAGDPNIVSLGNLITYSIPFVNSATGGEAGLTLSSGGVNMPLVISDTIPQGTQYVGGSADCSIDSNPTCEATVLYSTDSGATWSLTDPGTTTSTYPDNLVIIQWWLDDPLPASSSGYATFQSRVPGDYTGSSFIENCAVAQFGRSTAFAEACTTTMLSGTASITGIVWEDKDNNGLKAGISTEPGIFGSDGVPVYLYWDRNGDGVLDDDDQLILTTLTTSTDDPNYNFSNLPPGDYLVVVNTTDSDIPQGYRPTTPTAIAVTGLTEGATDTGNDFGFGPALNVVKSLTETNPPGNGGLATFTITLENLRPGDGTEAGFCKYTTFSNHLNTGSEVPASGTGNAAWLVPDNAVYTYDGAFAESNISNNTNNMALSEFLIGQQPGNITKVEMYLYLREIRDLPAGSGDNLQITLFLTDTSVTGNDPTFTYDDSYFTNPVGSDYVIVEDITSYNPTWNWADFSSSIVEFLFIADKGTGNVHGDFAVDAVAVKITTDRDDCGGPSDVIMTLPLTDTYDADLMTFVSAVPAPTNDYTTGAPNSTIGYITWDDLGPLYPGGSKTVEVTFRVLEPSVDGSANINTAEVTNAYFADSTPTNDDSDTAEVSRSSISGRVWSDVSPIGWDNAITGYSGADTFVPNVDVTLYGCYNKLTNGLITSSDTGFSANKSCTSQDINGSQNVGEWRVVATDVTDPDGNFLFVILHEGFYYVEVDETSFPHGTATQTADPNPNGGGTGGSPCSTCDHMWSDPSDDLNTTNFNEVGANEDITNVNFGYIVPATIFGRLWHDVEGDGVEDSGDPPLANVTIELSDGSCTLGSDCPTTTTDSEGNYVFSNLAAGDYTVHVDESTLPGGGTWSQTVDPDESGVCSTSCDGATTSAITLTAGQVDGSYDFAYTQTGTASLGDTVYRDWNGDGNQDAGEEGISDVTLRLYLDNDGDGVIDTDDAVVTTTTTDSNGNYTFTDLPDGNYIVEVASSPSATVQSQDPDGTNDNVARKIVISGGTATIDGNSCPDGCNDDVDFGYKPYGFGSIGDFVWEDLNGDGVQDDGEPSVTGPVTIWLYEDFDGDGIIDPGEDALVSTTTTFIDGSYLFENLPAGNYLVDIDTEDTDLPSGYELTTGNDPLSVTLSDRQEYMDADFGFAPIRIGDLIWMDSDGNGTFNPESESGIANVTVEIYTWTDSDSDGLFDDGEQSATPLDTTSTDSSGLYTFTNLLAGSYVVKVDTSTLPWTDFTQTGDPDARSVPCSDSDPLAELRCNPYSAAVVSAGQIDLTHDFGYQPHGSIGDYVWFDLDGDGVQDSGEQGIEDILVTLDPPAGIDLGAGPGQPITATTDSNGYYSFGGLLEASGYQISIAYPGSLAATYDADDATNDPDASVTFDISSNGSAIWSGVQSCNDANRGCNMDLDFGLRSNGSYAIRGHVFYDDGGAGDGNSDTYISGTDRPYENITVYLWDDSGNLIGRTTTDASGQFAFTNLLDGQSYTVSVNPASPQLSALDLTASPNPDNAYNSVTISGADVENQDFGFNGSIDFGDLPDSYSTRLSSEGPGHTIGDLYLGSLTDSEADGQDDPAAQGDDNDGDGNDDDGITFIDGPWFTPGAEVWIRVNVVGDNGFLVGFFDWNNDGDFNDSGEIIPFGNVTAGTNQFSINQPSTMSATNTLNMRFRLYDVETMSYYAATGLAANGEVEDYQRYPDSPTAVTLLDFTIVLDVDAAQVVWATALEIDTWGYNIYRTTEPYLPPGAEPLNESLIPVQLGGFGNAYYEFIDGQIEPGQTYYYWLEYVGLSGNYIFDPQEFTLNKVYLPAITR
jgi:hypothetical protein